MANVQIVGIWRESERPHDKAIVHFELQGLGGVGKTVAVEIGVRVPDQNISGLVNIAQNELVEDLEKMLTAAKQARTDQWE